MVEFGLKLEDNKVADWSDHYIRYERLKQLLKNAGTVKQKYKDLAAKKPDLAETIAASYREGAPTPFSSTNSLQQQQQPKTEQPKPEQQSLQQSTMAAGLATVLGTHPSGSSTYDYGSMRSVMPDSAGSGSSSGNLTRTDSSGNVISRAIGKATSGVTGYFSKSYERQLRDILKDVDRSEDEFRQDILEDINRVNSFYTNKLEELEARLNNLKESVAQFRVDWNVPSAPPPPSSSSTTGGHVDNDNEQNETPLVSVTGLRKSAIDVAKSLTMQLSAMTPHRGNHQQHHHRKTNSSALPIITDMEDTLEQDEGVDAEENRGKRLKAAESIQRALVDQYRTSKLLHNYAIMNYTGFVKIVKKHDKTLPEYKGRFKKDVSSDNICKEGAEVEKLANLMEQLYAKWFTGGNVSEARAQMLPKRGDSLQMDWSQLRLGYRLGMCSVLALWVCWDCIWGLVAHGFSTIGGRDAFPVFRGVGGLVLLQWFWGFSVWVWSRYRVNYIFLFDFSPRIVGEPLSLFNDAVDNSLVFLTLTLLYYKAGAHDLPGTMPAGIFPFLLVLYTVYQLIFPLRTRGPMWTAIWQTVTSPLTSPTFFHGYVGDIFTSMVKVFQDLAWAFFFVVTGDFMVPEDKESESKYLWSHSTWYSKILIPLITLAPLWIRFNQCLRRYVDTGKRIPNLPNAFKYALSQTVTLFGAFHPLYMKNELDSEIFQFFWSFVFIASSLYSFTWDVYMDWGLGLPKYNFLGPRLMYPRRPFYYTIIAIDLVLRFAWVLTLVPPQSGAKFALPAYLTAVSMFLELFRRTIWGFLRLENEHRSNTAGFRRVDFVPLHFSTGHSHDYKQGATHRGFSVLAEVAVVTILVLAAAAVSIVAAQHATQRSRDEL